MGIANRRSRGCPGASKGVGLRLAVPISRRRVHCEMKFLPLASCAALIDNERVQSACICRPVEVGARTTVMVEPFLGAAQDARITIRAGRLVLIGTALPAIDATT
jgi:hypothetical protein